MDRETYLLHQVHAAKLATDLAADAVSTWLMWHRRPRASLVVAHLLAAVASACVARSDLSALKETRRGRYVLSHMPPSAQAVRYLGQVLAWHEAYRRRPAGIALGHVIVAAGWSHGLLLRRGGGRAAAPEGAARAPRAPRASRASRAADPGLRP